MEDTPTWHLLKHEDDSQFGPVTLAQLVEWAKSAQISPLDKISKDGDTWTRAPITSELEMDWLIQTSPDSWYGPTTIEAVAEFLKAGELAIDAIAINCKTSAEIKIKQIPGLVIEEALDDITPGRATTREYLRSRVRELELLLHAERRKSKELEEAYAELASQVAASSE